MKFENTWTGNWDGAIRGMRHPLESYNKSDSYNYTYGTTEGEKGKGFELGSNDLDLAQRLIKAGSPNEKFLRQIFVSVDITAPLFIWKELDQYKVATVTDSTSTMHKLAATPITKECFEMDDYDGSLKVFDREPYNIDDYVDDIWDSIIDYCETLRKRYLETKDKRYWKELIRILPESWLQKRQWTANYAVLRAIVHQRKGHRLTEWASFIDWCKTLPYANELIFYNNTPSVEK